MTNKKAFKTIINGITLSAVNNSSFEFSCGEIYQRGRTPFVNTELKVVLNKAAGKITNDEMWSSLLFLIGPLLLYLIKKLFLEKRSYHTFPLRQYLVFQGFEKTKMSRYFQA